MMQNAGEVEIKSPSKKTLQLPKIKSIPAANVGDAKLASRQERNVVINTNYVG